jgi:tetratricopeptide (TPR) repeat protein
MTGSPTISELGAALERFEMAPTLSPAEFEEYFDTEVQLEAILAAIAGKRAANLDHEGARDLLDQVVKLNRDMREVTARQLRREDRLDDAYRERLLTVSATAAGLMLLVQGQIHQSVADEQMLGGKLPEARHSLETAATCYAELRDGDFPQSVIGGIARASMVTRIEFVDGMAAMQRGRYETAKEFFEEAYSKYGVMSEELAREAEVVDERARSSLEELQREFQEQSTYTSILIRYVDFFCQMGANNYEEAVVYATDAVSLYEAWLNRALAADLSEFVQRLRRMELEYFQGWESWARAEYAVDTRQWDECHRLLLAARKHWSASADLARRYALLGLMTPQYQIANAEMLLQSTRRRRASEMRLDNQLTALREENRQLRATHIVNNAYGGHAVKNEENSNITIKGDVTGPVGAGRAKVRAGDISTGDTVTETTVDKSTTVNNLADLRQLADELSELREVMAAGAHSQTERESVHHVELAEQQARVGDEKGAREHLKAAGRWALSFAERLTMTAAETMIRTSIGT